VKAALRAILCSRFIQFGVVALVIDIRIASANGAFGGLSGLTGARAVFCLTESIWDSPELANMIQVWCRDMEAGTDDSTTFQ
jgi:hypothetical protein